MCHYIYLVLPATAEAEAVRALVERHGRVLEPAFIDDRRLVGIPPDARAYATGGHCDCGTTLARSPRRDRGAAAAREEARLRKQGWSEAKLRRRREQRASAAERHDAARAGAAADEAAAWSALLDDLLAAGLPHVGIAVHWATDELVAGPTRTRAAIPATVAELDENVIYRFTR